MKKLIIICLIFLLSWASFTPVNFASTILNDDCLESPVVPTPTDPVTPPRTVIPPGGLIPPPGYIPPTQPMSTMGAMAATEAEDFCDDYNAPPIIEVAEFEHIISHELSSEESNLFTNQTTLEIENQAIKLLNEENLKSNNISSFFLEKPEVIISDSDTVDYYLELDKKGVTNANFDQEKYLDKTNTSIAPDARPPLPVSSYEVTGSYVFDTAKKTITLKQTITRLVGPRPVIITGSFNLSSRNTLEGAYTKGPGLFVEWKGADIYLGKSASKTFPISATKFWVFNNVVVFGSKGSLPSKKTVNSYPVLANKVGMVYPKIYDPVLKKYLPMPTRTDMAVVPLANRVSRTAAPYRQNYIDHYVRTYGSLTKRNWSEYQIHHIKPLMYGGNHAISNLFPLKKDDHQNRLHGKGWWTNY